MLDEIIAPEVKDDEFYFTLKALAGRADVMTLLEIGSSSGGGSTKAIVEGIAARNDADSVTLFCMELSIERFKLLREAYLEHRFFKPYNYSSASLDMFPSEMEVTNFFNRTRTNLNRSPIEVVLGWLRQDIEYVRSNDKNTCGIDVIKAENGIQHFDMVLIDGSEFTGEQELYKTIGAKIIALDDVNAHKNFNSYRILSSHVHYKLTSQNLGLRNGFAVFERTF